MVYLSTEQCVDARSAREDDERETNDCADNKAELHQFTEQRRPKIHQDITDNLMVVERYIAKETYLQHTCRQANIHAQNMQMHKIYEQHKNSSHC